MIDFRLLVKAGVHFGHQSSRWNPRMAPYIWGTKNNVHLINVAKTAVQLDKACKALEKIVAEGKTVLWIGTKKPAQQTMMNAAQLVGMPYVTHRWIGGTLTNFPQVKKSVTRYLHFKDVVTKADTVHYTKKELNTFQKIVERLHKNIGGIVNLAWPVGAIVVVDVKKEASAIKEAAVVGVPVFALVDTNGDPLLVNYVIPGNDDSVHSIEAVIKPLTEAALRGKQVADTKKKEEEKELELLREKRRAERKEGSDLSPVNEALVALLEKEEDEEATGKKSVGKKTFPPRREGQKPFGQGGNKSAGGQKRTFTQGPKKDFGSSSSAPRREFDPNAPKREFDPSAPRREFDPSAPRREFTPGPRREFDPNAPKREFDPNAPKREFDPNRPRRPYDPNAPKREFDPNAPKREWDPNRPRRPYDPNAPKREFDPNRPRRPYDPNAPKREFDPNAPKREFDPNRPRRPYDPNAPKREFDPNRPRRPYDPNAPKREFTPRPVTSEARPVAPAPEAPKSDAGDTNKE